MGMQSFQPLLDHGVVLITGVMDHSEAVLYVMLDEGPIKRLKFCLPHAVLTHVNWRSNQPEQINLTQ